MTDEKLDKRANGSAGGWSGGGGSRRSSVRRGYRETERVLEGIRDHFSAFFDALYFSRGASGVRGATARRELAARLDESFSMLPHITGLLRVEAVDMEREARDEAEREAAEVAKAETKAKEENAGK